MHLRHLLSYNRKMKREKILNTAIALGFILYFLILFVERTLALFLSVDQGGVYALSGGSFIGVATYCVTAVSIVLSIVALIPSFPDLWKAVFSKERYDYKANAKRIILPCILLLFGGMMHTGWTLAPLQFVAYGFLILAMILHCVDTCLKDKQARFPAIVSVIYLTLFSMAIPVCYSIADNGAVGVIYYISEFLCVFLLVPFFGFALRNYFETGADHFSFLMLAIMVVLDGFIIGLKWNEEINFFLLIFASLSTLYYAIFVWKM